MLSHLNTLIGFAALFAILSLLITGLTQIVRSGLRMKTQSLIERLERLFGELKDTRRFVAAILAHPSLEGARGARHYRVLIDPGASEPGVRTAADAVLGNAHAWWPVPWVKTVDLDKQTIKDIGQTVYEQIGYLVDYPLEADTSAEPRRAWARSLKSALEQADQQHVSAMKQSVVATGATAAVAPGAPHGTAVPPFRGRMWMLATSAFPEAEGKTPPLKTYVAAFHDEADASASDRFTWRMRAVTLVISAVIAISLQLDAVAVWRQMARADPAHLEALEKAAQALAPGTAPATTAPSGTADPDAARREVLAEIGALKASEFDLSIRPSVEWLFQRGGEPLLGFLLAVAALSLGAPFWFETLKSAIMLRSAFTKPDAK